MSSLINKTMGQNLNSIVVVGTVRNCGSTIIPEYERLEKALAVFKETQYCIIESDSKDDTIHKLESLKRDNSNINYQSFGKLSTKIPKRTERIAYCRNRYLDELKNNEKYKNTEYVMVTDLDGVNDLISKEAVLSCWEFDGWDVCTANQEGVYYDVYALRHPVLFPINWNIQYQFLINELGIGSIEAKNISLYSKMFTISKSCKPIIVESAFGGMAIYKREILQDVKYIGLDESGDEICEHVALHDQMRKSGYKIYINPKLINCKSPIEHMKLFSKKMLLKHMIEEFFPFLLRGKLFKSIQQRVNQC